VPFTVGGGMKDVASAAAVLEAGADKVSVSSAAFKTPALVPQLIKEFGPKVTIAIDDISLPLPMMKTPDVRQSILEVVLDVLAGAGVQDVHVIIANSFHRRLTPGEMRRCVGRKIFVHVNNTNPILLADSPERAIIEKAGWEAAHDGMEITL
jgi:hypothetical protein